MGEQKAKAVTMGLGRNRTLLAALFLLFGLPGLALGQGGSINSGAIIVLSATGRPIGGATVTICAFGATGIPCSPTITVYTDPTLGTPATNPATSDGNGNVFRYASPGRYTFTVTGTGIVGTSYTATVSGSGGGTGDVLSGGNNAFTGANTFKNLNQIRFADQFASIQAAINDFGGSCGTVLIPPGTFTGNIVITTSTCGTNGNVILQGAGRRSTILKPSSNAAVITIDSTAGAVQSVQIRDIGFDNTATGFTQPAVLIQGGNINDFHQLRNLWTNGFKNSINIIGRTIWSVFDDIGIANDTDIALNVVSAASPINFNKFHMVSITSAAGAEGALLSCTGTCGGQSLHIGNEFDLLDIENGSGIGMVLNNTEATTITSPYFETNAGIQISATGTYARALNIRGGYMNTPNNTVDISITATQISGEIFGNFIANNGGGASTISVAGGSGNGMFVHGNFEPNSGPHTNTADGAGTFHASYYGSYAPTTVTTTGSQTPAVGGINHLRYTNASAATITNFTGGDPGQVLTVFNEGASTVTFTHINANGPFMPNSAPVTIGNGGTCSFFLEPANGRWVNTGCILQNAAPSNTIASGTSTLTANAALAAVTSQAAITTAATGALTTDAFEWSYASAPTAGDSLCVIQPYVTAGNVNFVRANPTAGAQNVSAIVINWKVVR